jgi:hypothetical protein
LGRLPQFWRSCPGNIRQYHRNVLVVLSLVTRGGSRLSRPAGAFEIPPRRLLNCRYRLTEPPRRPGHAKPHPSPQPPAELRKKRSPPFAPFYRPPRTHQ